MAAMIAQGRLAKFSGNLPGSPFASRPVLDGSAGYVGARAWPRDGAIIFRDLIGKLQIQAQSSLKRLTIRLEIHDALASPPVRSRSAITRPSQIDQLRARETQPGLAVIGSIVTSRTSPCDWGE